MMQYQSNISQVVKLKVKQFSDLQNPDQMLRNVASGVLPELKKRVHILGQATDGGQIGTYSPGYMALRTGNYSNSKKVTRGAKKGQNKDAGVATRGSRKGQARMKYSRTADSKVILSLTRQMENDLSIVPSGKGYGIGFKNPENFRKSQYNEKTYKKRIWGLTLAEKQLAIKIAEAFISENLKS